MGALIILLTLGALALVVTGEFLVSPFFIWIGLSAMRFFQRIFKGAPVSPVSLSTNLKAKQRELENFRSMVLPLPTELKTAPASVKPAPSVIKPNIHIVATPKREPVPEAVKAPKAIGEYHLPNVDLLQDPPIVSDHKIQERLIGGAKILEETLADFGDNIKVVDIHRAPTITRYD